MAERLVVLGGGGRLGRLLRPAFGHAVVQSRDPGQATAGACLDPLRDGAALARLVAGAGAVLVLSGVTRGTAEELSLNTDLARAALAAARAGGARRVLIASSGAAYGGGGPFAEAAGPAPAGAYGAAKADMEAAVLRDAAGAGGPGVTLLRIGNVAGADWLLGGGLRPIVLDRCAGGQGPLRSYIGPATLAHVLAALARLPGLPEVLNVALPGVVAMADLLRAAGHPFDWREGASDMPERVELDTARLWSILDRTPPPGDAAAIVAEWSARRTTGASR